MRRLCHESSYPSALLAVAGHRLDGAIRPFPDTPLVPEAWSGLVAAAASHRLTGLLRSSVDGGRLPATDAQRAEVRNTHRMTLLRVLSLEQHLVSMVSRLAAADVETRVLKGSAYAHLDYPDPALRSFIDLDLLFRPDDIAKAVAVLESAGLTRILAEPRPGFDRRFDKGTTLRGPDFEIDLHRTFVLGPWGLRLDLDALWSDAEPFTIGGHPLYALSAQNRFLHACYHAALGDWPLRLGSLRDVAELHPADERGAITQATEWGVQAVVAAAVADSTRLLGLPVSGELRTWAAAYVPTRREESWLGLHTQENKTFAAQAIATLPALPGLRDKAAYLRALLLPDAGYTADRHTSTLSRIRFGVREALKGRGR
ncbi:nucleotidyltransferase family protein [Actinophytocola oryzae]|uniref:Putative nucleotidyltransferase-like protein n=1 Tax=Actinophytocola oryzae TaxID=502181 RepID=A0A4R7VD51_9PSEU|nr:nucleotidyltransferase family protein [Actinophytocola oryzae]TDV46899.1 putative nucleotidyltransferase-like protein [Actinophytocola oryzae]